MQTLNRPLSNMQLELLKLFSRDIAEEDLKAIKMLIVEYLSDKLDRQTDKVWEEKGWTEEDMEKLLNTHMRTPYRSDK